MAKTLDKLRSQKPSWIHVDEPVSGSTNPSAQDATVLASGDVTPNVEGVDNRCTATLWGLLNLLADIVEFGHEEDGSHQLTNADIADNAKIDESKGKLDLMSAKIARPDDITKNYETTKDIAEVINIIWPSQVQALYLSQIEYANSRKFQSILEWIMPPSWSNKKTIVSSEQQKFIVADDEVLTMAGYRIRLFGSNNANETGRCFYDIGDGSGRHGAPWFWLTRRLLPWRFLSIRLLRVVMLSLTVTPSTKTQLLRLMTTSSIRTVMQLSRLRIRVSLPS